MESFLVTAVSIIQFPTLEHKSTDRDAIAIDTNSDNRNPNCQLPAEYSHVTPVSLLQIDCFAPASEGEVKTDISALYSARERESSWLSVMAELVLEKEQLDCCDFVSCSAYNANRQAADIRPVSPIYLSLPPLKQIVIYSIFIWKADRILHSTQVNNAILFYTTLLSKRGQHIILHGQ